MSRSSGRFIVVEGPDGAGKTVLVAGLAQRMREQGHDAVVVREPGGTKLAEALRQELLDRSRPFRPLTELLYITAARADHVHHVIEPALARGQTVLSDRFDLSTMAYQVAGRGVSPETAKLFNEAATGGLQPDLTLVIDVPARIGMERQLAGGKRQDRLDLEDEAFQARVVAAYLAANGPGVRHLDGTMDRASVFEVAWGQLHEKWPEIFSSRGSGRSVR
jgi:dTMP kinase